MPTLTSEEWALAGVIVGAVLGGLAQVLAGSLQRRYDTARTLSAHRQAAYTRWVSTLHGFFNEIAYVTSFLGVYAASSRPLRLWVSWGPSARKVAARIEQNFPRLMDESWTALAELRLLAPEDTYAAALRSRDVSAAYFNSVVQHGYAGVTNPHETTAKAEFHRSRDAFVRLAQRDLGIPLLPSDDLQPIEGALRNGLGEDQAS